MMLKLKLQYFGHLMGVVGRVGTILHITEGISSLQLSHTLRGPSPLVYVLLLLPVIPTSAI